ncbi:hypothetical protein L3X38_008559 [Prunus dulcis]|uniref:Uncharacterized protein n=1 Tax=Prunus dulcis TaxID=3755 RepID=A0AAD4ZWS3_PRUDU|nr:hypothetical protein L3X38_008559 [Prunus dulcis]
MGGPGLAMCEDVGCELSEDLSQCDHILGIKKPKVGIILPDIAYAFFLSHSQGSEGNHATLGQGYLSLGYSTPFLLLGASYMYLSLDAAKAAVISVGKR